MAAQTIASLLEREILGFVDLFHRHGELGVAALYLWSILTQAIPTPGSGSSWFHMTLFNIAHIVAGNARMVGKKSGADGYIDRKLGTGRFSAAELDRMVREGDRSTK